MNIIRKYVARHKNQIFFLMIAAICAFGAYVANIIEDQFEIVINGILSLSLLYLIYLAFLSPKRIINEPAEVEFEFPKDIKYLMIGFLVTMIVVWASSRVFDLIQYFISGFANR